MSLSMRGAKRAVSTAAPPADAIDLYPSWRRIGVNFTGAASAEPVDVERLIIATASRASTDERLTVCAASWLAQYHDLVDGRRLSELTRETSLRTRGYLGAMLSLAIDGVDGAGRAPQFDTALSHCRPLRDAQPFYDSTNTLPALRLWMLQRALPIYRRWHLWHDDASLQHKSVQSLRQLLKVPELRARALLGPSIEASCIAHTQQYITNARSLSRALGATYAATHAAVERLVGRGLLIRTRNGVRQDLRLSELCTAVMLC
jgi:DNA-binding MarR family transcriptional regulator